jgi:hypothetical protein
MWHKLDPEFSMMQAQYLRFHRAVDHRRLSAEAPTSPRAQPRERRQRRMAKVAPSGLAVSVVVTLLLRSGQRFGS